MKIKVCGKDSNSLQFLFLQNIKVEPKFFPKIDFYVLDNYRQITKTTLHIWSELCQV